MFSFSPILHPVYLDIYTKEGKDMPQKTEISRARRELKSPNKKTHRRALKTIKSLKRQKTGLTV